MTIQNTGSNPWTLTNMAQVSLWTQTDKTQVNFYTDLTVTDLSVKNGGAYNCTHGKSIKISITMNPGWVSGNQYYYSITLFMTDGTKIGFLYSAP
jgi:hypothetical protein